jgi:DNA-binding PadR family transcriptional regulator
VSLSTTHHALLCLLEVGPGSAYELVARMERSTGHVWPRARSNLYADLKRLAAEGLAATADEGSGRRPRTVYRSTAAGRRALRAWLAEPGAPPTGECEAALKLGFATAAGKEAALAQIAVIEADAAAGVTLGEALGRQHAADNGPLPERLHVNALLWRYLWDQAQARLRWARWARAEVEGWDAADDTPANRARGRTAIAESLAEAQRSTTPTAP